MGFEDQCGQDVSLGPFRDLGSNGDQEWARFESPHQGTDLSKMSSAIGCLHYFYDYINRVIISFWEREMNNSANTETHIKEVIPRATATEAAAIKETK